MTLQALITFFGIHSAPAAIPAPELAAAVLAESKAAGVDSTLVAKVIMQESRGMATATNKRTKDFGLMQINEKTAAGLKITKECLNNWRCNLRHGVKLLAKASRPCAYNLGAAGAIRWPKSCIKYETKLASFN